MKSLKIDERTVSSFGQEWSTYDQATGRGSTRLLMAREEGMRRTTLGSSTLRVYAAAVLAFTLLLSLKLVHACDISDLSAKPLHYAANGNFDKQGNYLPGRAGFNLADVSHVGQLKSLVAGEKALVWVGLCNGADEHFIKKVTPFIGDSRVFGFFLMDDPDPRGILEVGRPPSCKPEDLKAESDWIHDRMPGARTFIVLMNLATSKAPSFEHTYSPENSHIDLFGIDPYPCRTEVPDCDDDMIDRYVAAAASWGIPRAQMVPFFQAFGGGDWKDDNGGRYMMPTVEQAIRLLSRWKEHVAAPEFDAVYSWGAQRSDAALESNLDLQAVFAAHNQESGPPLSQ